MKNCWRALFLIIPSLLLMLGQGVKIGFCPCHQTLFVIDCGCTGAAVEQSACTDECCAGNRHITHNHSESHIPTEIPSNSDEDHDCGNITAEPSPYPYVYTGGDIHLPDYSPDYFLVSDTSLPPISGAWDKHILPLSTGPPSSPPILYLGFLCPLII